MGLFDSPEVGGTSKFLKDQQKARNINEGGDRVDLGTGILGGVAEDARRRGLGSGSTGMNFLGDGRNLQNAAFDTANVARGSAIRGIASAGRDRSSVAEALLRQGLDQSARQSLGLAQSGGPGQGAMAVRTALEANANANTGFAQQAAVMRAQEEQSRADRELSAINASTQLSAQLANTRAQMAGQQLSTGAQLIGEDNRMQLGLLGVRSGAGGQIAGSGATQQGQFLGAQTQVDIAQAQMDAEAERQRQAMIGGAINTGGAAIGGI